MQTYRHKKIERVDLHAEYPCPCCHRGQLSLITLTDALGCDRCQEIFALREDGYLLESLKAAYPYLKTWYWTGTQWTVQPSPYRWHWLFSSLMWLTTLVLLFAILLVLVWFTLSIVPPLAYGWWILILGMVIGFSIIFWNIFQG